MKAYRIGILFSFILAMLAGVICKPEWLSDNEFLEKFISHEIVAVLVVIWTITLAAFANVHLSLSKIKKPKNANIKPLIKKARREINSSARVIIWAFIFCVAALLAKGAWGSNIYVVALAHGVGLTVLLVNVLIVHDLYRATYKIAEIGDLK